jgi:hypothetical protein
MKIFITAIILAFALTVFGIPNSFAEVYTWTDEDGIKHFSDQPPQDPKDRVKPAFPSYKYNEAADRQQNETDSKELQKIVESIDETYEKEQQEAKQRQAEEEANRPPTMEERVAAEREKLNQKIAELEAKPLEFFGSQRNKIRMLGYFNYRLEDLARDPEKYFGEPTRFEGNVQLPAEDQN